MKTKKTDSRATLILLIFAALILLGLGSSIARGLGDGAGNLGEIKNRVLNAVSGVR